MQSNYFNSLPEYAKYDDAPPPVRTQPAPVRLGNKALERISSFNDQHRDSYVDDVVDSFQSDLASGAKDMFTGARQLFTDNPNQWNVERNLQKSSDTNRLEIDPARLKNKEQFGIGDAEHIDASNLGLNIAGAIGTSIPSALGAAGATATTVLAGASAPVTTAAAAITTGLINAGMISGSSANEVAQRLNQMSPAELQALQDKVTQAKYDSPEAFKYAQQQEAAKGGALIGGASGLVAGPIMGRAVTGLGTQTALRRIGTTAATEGLTEFGDEFTQAMLTNKLTGTPTLQNAMKRGVEGMILGAGTGATVGGTGAAINKLLPDTGAISKAVNTGTIVNAKQELKAQPIDTEHTLSPEIKSFSDATGMNLIDLTPEPQQQQAWAKYDSIPQQPINKTITALENNPAWSQTDTGAWTDGINVLNVDANKLAPPPSEALVSQLAAGNGSVTPEQESRRPLEISPESQDITKTILQKNKEVNSILKARNLDNPLNQIIASKIEAMNQDGLNPEEYHSLLSGFADSFNAGVLAAENNEVSNTRSNEDPYYFSGASLIGKDNIQRNEQEQVQPESINPEAFSFYSEKTDEQLTELLKRFGLTVQQRESRDSLINRIIEKEYGPKTEAKLDQYDTAPIQFPDNPQDKVRVEQIPRSHFNSPVQRVNSNYDAARLVKSAIGNDATESMLAIVTDKNGEVLNVIRHTEGLKASSSVAPGDLVSSIVNTPGAKSVRWAHSHPSGKTASSDADEKITLKLNKLLEGTGVTPAGHVIVVPHQDKYYDLDSGKEETMVPQRAESEAKHPMSLTKRVIVRRDMDNPVVINSPATGRQAAAQIHGDSGLVLMDTRNQVIGSLPLTQDEMLSLKNGDKPALNEIFKAIDRTNTSAVIIKGDSKLGAANVARFLNAHGDVRVLDYIDRDGKSDAEGSSRIIKASGPYYQKVPAKTKGQTAQQLESSLNKQLGSYRNINIVNQQSELPASILKNIAPDDVISGVYDPTTNTIYLVANNISADKSASILRHEVVHGVLKYSPAYQEALRELDKQKGTEHYQQAEQAATQAGTKPADMQEEILAYYLQADKKLPFVRRLLSRLKSYLRQYFNIDMSLDDISLLLTDMAKGDVDFGTKMPNGAVKFHAVFHGTPHKIQGRMSTDHIGTGEGAQAQGWGLYFADLKGVTKHYRDKLANGQAIPIDLLRDYFKPGNIIPSYGGQDKVLSFQGANLDNWSAEVISVGQDSQPIHGARPRVHSTLPDAKAIKHITGRQLGNLYGVELKPKQTEYLNWDKPLTQQSKHVRNAITTMGMGSFINNDMTGKDFYNQLVKFYTSEPDSNWMIDNSAAQKQASLELLNTGIRGNKYRDASGKGSYNYVIFDDSDIEITHKFSKKPAKAKPSSEDGTTAPGVQDASARFNEVINSGSALTDFIKNKKEDWRPALLGTLTLRQLADIGREYLPQLQDYVHLNTKMQTERNAASEQYNALAENWRKWAARNRKEAEALSSLMHDSTLAGIDPSQSDNNPVLKRRYNKLSGEAQQLFQNIRDSYILQNQRMADALQERIESSELNHKQKEVLKLEIRNQFEQAKSEGIYFPLSRFGQYWLAAKDSNGERLFSMYENHAELVQAEKQLKSQGYTGITTGRQLDKARLGDADESLMVDLNDVLQRNGIDPNSPLMDDVYQVFLRTMPSVSMRKSFIHRQGTQGFSPDALRSYASHSTHNASQTARLRYSGQMKTLLDDAKDRSDSVKSTALVNEMQKRHEWVMNPSNSKIAQKASAIGFAWFLGMNPASAMVNLTQNALVTMPVLASKHGAVKSFTSMNKVLGEFLKAKGNFDKTLKGQRAAAFRAMQASGAIDVTQAHNLAGLSETDSMNDYSPKMHKAMKGISYLFHKAEVLNRAVSGMAAYDLAREKGLSHNHAIRYAEEVIWTSHFDYGNANRARFMQDDFAKVLLMFRQYSQNVSYYLMRNFYQMFKGESSEVRAEARKKLTGTLGVSALMSGGLGLPMVSTLAATANTAASAFGDDDEPYDFNTELRAFLADYLGKDGAAYVLDGAVNQLTSAAVSDRVKLNDLWLRAPSRDMEGRDSYHYYLEQIAGPIGSIPLNAMRGMQLINEGHLQRGIEAMLPIALKNAAKSIRYEQSGVNTLRGDPLVDDISSYEEIIQAAGFTPARVSDQYKRNNSIKNYERHILTRRNRLLAAFAMVRASGNGTQSILKDMRAFSKKYPGLKIDAKTIHRSMKTRARYSQRNQGGINVNKKLGDYLSKYD